MPPVFNAVNNALKLSLINLQSINGKFSLINDLIDDNSIDILIVTETWHMLSTDVALRSAAPTGYSIIDVPRPVLHDGVSVNHGGLAIFHGPSLSARFIHLPLKPTTFELMVCILKSGTNNVICAAIYRPGSQPATAMFMDEFSAVLEVLAIYQSTVIIAGDFNIHCDVADDVHTARLLDLLDAFGLRQHVDKPTHVSGHTLDLIITAVDTILSHLHVDPPNILSDHSLITCNLPISLQPVDRRRLRLTRRLNMVDSRIFSARVQTSSLCVFPLEDLPLDALCARYSAVLSNILDDLAPTKAIMVKDCPKSPWFDSSIQFIQLLIPLAVMEASAQSGNLLHHQ